MVRLNVMVVDDSLLAIKKMETLLLKMGHYVRKTASSGAEAVTNYRMEIPDLVTMAYYYARNGRYRGYSQNH